MSAPFVIFGVGNRSRGDDAVGALLLERLRQWLEEEGRAGDFELVEEYQLQVENALDLEGRRLALFVDARRGATVRPTFDPASATSALAGHSTHALSPGAVLGVYRQVTGGEPPLAFVLGIGARDFELGAPLSSHAREAMEEGWTLLRSLCLRPRHSEWLAVASAGRDAPPSPISDDRSRIEA